MTKKALLILFGGRPLPNVLTMIHEKPDLIVAIVSKDMQNLLPQLSRTIEELFKGSNKKPELNTDMVVDAFLIRDTQEKCKAIVQYYPGYDWIFNITSATTIMSIGAYEAAKELVIRYPTLKCWYLNSRYSQVVPLIGPGRDSDIFSIAINEYLMAYDCKLGPGNLDDQKKYAEDHWLPFTYELVHNLSLIDTLKGFTDEIRKKLKELKDLKKQAKIKKSTEAQNSKLISLIFNKDDIPDIVPLLEKAKEVSLLGELHRKGNQIYVSLSSIQYNFLNGSWLELYVWDEARKLRIFSDSAWNQKVFDLEKQDTKDNLNELDVTLMYEAQFLAVECKTGKDTFTAETLYKFDSITNALGGDFVSKLLVTSLSVPTEGRSSYDHFIDRAEDRGIVVATREDLVNVKNIIEQQARNPKKPRK